MPLYFITGNKNKFTEVKAILGDVVQLDIDLPEIQDLDPHKIIQEKLVAALSHHTGPLIVEDISLSLDCLNGLPGPLIKWFLKAISIEGIYDIANKYHNFKATTKVIYGYAKNKKDIKFFEGELRGDIVSPRGKNGFGFDSIFRPIGQSKTQAEMNDEEKNLISTRRLALNKLGEYLLE